MPKQLNDINTGSSMNDASLREQDEKGMNHPDRGLTSRDTEALGSDAYQDPHTDADFSKSAAHWSGSTEQEGGASTKDTPVFGSGAGFKDQDIHIGGGNRMTQTSGASMGKRQHNVPEAEGTSLVRDEQGAGLSEDMRKGIPVP
jgi:hypothetical protein